MDKMVLHLRSSNIDGKSSRFMNIEVVTVNAIMIRFRFMDGNMVQWYLLWLWDPHLTIKWGPPEKASVALATQELQPVWLQFVDLHRLRGIALRGTSSRCLLMHSCSKSTDDIQLPPSSMPAPMVLPSWLGVPYLQCNSVVQRRSPVGRRAYSND